MVRAWVDRETLSVLREYAILAGFAAILAGANLMALTAFGMSCDYFVHGEPPDFLCLHARARLGLSLFCYLGVALYVCRRANGRSRRRRWSSAAAARHQTGAASGRRQAH